MGLFKSKMAKEGDKQKGSKEHGEGNTTPSDPTGKGGNHGNKGKTVVETKFHIKFIYMFLESHLL